MQSSDVFGVGEWSGADSMDIYVQGHLCAIGGGEVRIGAVFLIASALPFTRIWPCSSANSQSIHRYRPRTSVYDVDEVFTGSETGHLTRRLLRVSFAGGGQVGCSACFTVNLNFDLPGSRLQRSDN